MQNYVSGKYCMYAQLSNKVRAEILQLALRNCSECCNDPVLYQLITDHNQNLEWKSQNMAQQEILRMV